MVQDRYEVAIVGGGVAGLCAAWSLRDRNVILLEEKNRLGGRLRSEGRGEYWLNMGGHLFPGEGSYVGNLVSALGLRTIPVPGVKTALAFEGKVYTPQHVELYPFMLPLSVSERASLARAGLKVRRAVRGLKATAKGRSAETQEERLDRVLNYLNDRSFRDLIGLLPPRVDAIFQAAGRRAAAEIEWQSAGVAASLFGAVWSGKRSSLALNLYGGSGEFARRLSDELNGAVVRDAAVIEVRELSDSVVVKYRSASGESQVTASYAIVAVPAPIARRIVSGLSADVAGALDSVSYGPFLSMAMLTTESAPMAWDGIYAMTTPGMAFDMFFNHANPLRTDRLRKPGGSLMVYSGGGAAEKLLAESDQEIERRYRTDVFRIYPQLEGLISEVIVQRWELGNTYRRPGTSFKGMLEYCSQKGKRVQFAGDYFGELGYMEIAGTSGARAGGRVRDALEAEALCANGV